MTTNFYIQFDCDNSAFDDNREQEIGRLLREVIDKIAKDGLEMNETRPILDVNGNKIGNFCLREVDDWPF